MSCPSMVSAYVVNNPLRGIGKTSYPSLYRCSCEGGFTSAPFLPFTTTNHVAYPIDTYLCDYYAYPGKNISQPDNQFHQICLF